MSQSYTKDVTARAEDSASAAGDFGQVVNSARQDTLSVTTSTDGDYQPLKSTDDGALWVALSEAIPAGTNNIGDVDVLSVIPGTAATNLGKAIDSASGATDTGVAALAVRDDALTTLTPADGDYAPLRVDSVGALRTTETCAAAAVTSVSDSATVVTLLSANANRRGASFFNEATDIAYVKMGSAASATDYSVQIAAGGYFELPQPIYVGIVTVLWKTDTGGAMRVTEYTN